MNLLRRMLLGALRANGVELPAPAPATPPPRPRPSSLPAQVDTVVAVRGTCVLVAGADDRLPTTEQVELVGCSLRVAGLGGSSVVVGDVSELDAKVGRWLALDELHPDDLAVVLSIAVVSGP